MFPIVTVALDMVRTDEPMGSKDKFWCEVPAPFGGGLWLFKEPRHEPGKAEHLAEKMAAEVGAALGVPCARVELAVFDGRRGTISRRIQEPGEALVHGNELIAGRVVGYDSQRKRRSSDHTWERIAVAIREVCGGNCDAIVQQFAGYLVLDALIANTDRHHENWAVLRRDSAGGASYRLAPSFDHASSLGREMRDARRLQLLSEARVESYLTGSGKRGGGGIYLEVLGDEAPNPIELVRQLSLRMPDAFRPWLRTLDAVNSVEVARIWSRFPERWATAPQRDFSIAVIEHSRQSLLEIAARLP